jgi:hypothetical protein
MSAARWSGKSALRSLLTTLDEPLPRHVLMRAHSRPDFPQGVAAHGPVGAVRLHHALVRRGAAQVRPARRADADQLNPVPGKPPQPDVPATAGGAYLWLAAPGAHPGPRRLPKGPEGSSHDPSVSFHWWES